MHRHIQAHHRSKDTAAFDSVHSSENMQSCDSVPSGVNISPCDYTDAEVKSLPCDSIGSGAVSMPYDSADSKLKSSPRDFTDSDVSTQYCDRVHSLTNPPASAALIHHTSLRRTVRPRLHACPECGKCFTRKQHLRRHLEVHKSKKLTTSFEPGVTPPRCRAVRFAAKPRLHPCPECGKSFTRKQHVQRHLQAHKHWKDKTAFDSVRSSENVQSSDFLHSGENASPRDSADVEEKSSFCDSADAELK